MPYSVISYLPNWTPESWRGAMGIKFVCTAQVAGTALSSVRPGQIPQLRSCSVQEWGGEQPQTTHMDVRV